METRFIVIGALLIFNIPLYYAVGKLLFEDWESFFEAIGYWIRPDFFSALAGEFWDDWWAELKLLAFLAICGFVVYLEYQKIVVPYILPALNFN